MVECSRLGSERCGKRWSWAWWSAVGLEHRGGEAVELGMVECSSSRAQRCGKRWSWAWWSAVGLERRGAGSDGAGHGGVQ